MLLDTHFHLDFLPTDARGSFVRELAQHDIGVIAQTLLPSDFMSELPNSPAPLALGFHPWEATSASLVDAELATFTQALPHTQLIGEIGLDFSPRRLESAPKELQLHALRGLLAALSGQRYVLSIHAVQSADAVIAELAQLDAANLVPIFHWFSGTSDELTAIRKMGCYISVNQKMLDSKKGRAYLRQYPSDHILLETDLPVAKGSNAGENVLQVRQQLGQLIEALSQLKGEDMRPVIEKNQQHVFGSI